MIPGHWIRLQGYILWYQVDVGDLGTGKVMRRSQFIWWEVCRMTYIPPWFWLKLIFHNGLSRAGITIPSRNFFVSVLFPGRKRRISVLKSGFCKSQIIDECKYRRLNCKCDNGSENARRVFRMQLPEILECVKRPHRPVCVGVLLSAQAHAQRQGLVGRRSAKTTAA